MLVRDPPQSKRNMQVSNDVSVKSLLTNTVPHCAGTYRDMLIKYDIGCSGDSNNFTNYLSVQVHAVGGKLVVDATFGPPPLQYPFKWGTDLILHSGPRFFSLALQSYLSSHTCRVEVFWWTF